jgi:hypothetical protein
MPRPACEVQTLILPWLRQPRPGANGAMAMTTVPMDPAAHIRRLRERASETFGRHA